MKKENLKALLEKYGISEEEFNKKTAPEQSNMMFEYISEKASKAVTKDELLKVNEELIDNQKLNKKNYDELIDKLKTQGEIINRLEKTTPDVPSQGSFLDSLTKAVEEKMEQIKGLEGSGKCVIDISKAAAGVTTGVATLPAALSPQVGIQTAPPSPARLRGVFVRDFTTNVELTDETLTYAETKPKDGDFDWLAEGAARPLMDFEIVVRTAKTKEIGVHVIATDKSLRDIKRLLGIITDLIRKKFALRVQKAILTEPVGVDAPTGVFTLATPFAVGAMALKVKEPNFLDVINAISTNMATSHNFTDEEAYEPNIVLINPIDFFIEINSPKNSVGNPLFGFSSFRNEITIGDIRVKSDRIVPQGKVFVGDMSKYIVSNYQDFRIEIGKMEKQLITGHSTVTASARYHAYVENNSLKAFKYDTIATIKTALKTV